MFRHRTAGALPALIVASLLAAPLVAALPLGPLPSLPGEAPSDPPSAPHEAPVQQAPPSEGIDAEKQRDTRDITFYGHVFGIGMFPSDAGEGEFGPDGPQPANTIFPSSDANLGLGFSDWCSDAGNFAGLPPTPSGSTGCDNDPNNKLALFLTAGPVQIHDRSSFTYSKMHNEHGRTKDVVLDTTKDVTAALWMSLDLHGWYVSGNPDGTACVIDLPRDVACPYPYWGWDPAFWPAHVVEATLYMVELGDYGQGASEPPPIADAWASGAMTVIAHGATEPLDVINGLPDHPNSLEFVVNLGKPQVEVIPKTHDVVMVFSWYSILGGQKVGADHWRIWSGEFFPTKFTMPVKNALDVEFVIPQFVHDKLLVHSVISAAWGSYDVDLKSAKVTVTNDKDQVVPMTTVRRVGDFQVAHGAHYKPVNLTWIWDYRADKLPAGAYKVTVEACNAQGSACETTEGGFTIGADSKPVEVRIGRGGQRTVSEGQLRDVTGSGAGSGTGGHNALDLDFLLGDLGLGEAASDAPGAAGPSTSPAQAPASPGARATPGPEAALLFLGVAALALLARRRWAR